MFEKKNGFYSVTGNVILYCCSQYSLREMETILGISSRENLTQEIGYNFVRGARRAKIKKGGRELSSNYRRQLASPFPQEKKLKWIYSEP